jgi:hypothetical protein
MPDPLLPSDLLVDPRAPDSSGTNLKALSVIRLHKLATLHQRDAFRRLGMLSTTAMQQVDTKVRALLGL